MRKLTLFIATLLLTVAKTVAFEGSTSVTNPEHLYFITNGNNAKVGKNAVNSNEAGCFAFYAVEGVDKAYYIYSLDEKKWFDYDMEASYGGQKNFVKLSSEKGNYFFIESCAQNKAYYQIRPYNSTGVASIYLNYYQGVDGRSTIGLWTTNGDGDAGSRWTFTETGYILEASSLSNDKVYNLTTTRGWLIYNENNASQVSSTASYTGFTTGMDVEACQWAIYKSEKTAKYYLYNIGAGKFVGKNSGEGGCFPFEATVTNDIQVVKSTTGTSHAFVFSTDNYGAINHFNHTAAPGVANWRGNGTQGGLKSLSDAGSAHRVVEVGTISNEALATIADLVAVYETLPELDAAITAAEAKAAWVGEAVGLYSCTGDYAAELQSIKGFRSAVNENTTLAEVQEKIATLNAMLGSLTLNTPQVGRYYRLKNAISNNYMSANSEGNGVVVINNGAEAASTIFYLDEGNVFRSYTRNLYLDCGNKILSSEKKSGLFEVAYDNAPTENTITYKNNNYWLFGNRDNGVSIDRGSSKNQNGYNWIIEEVTMAAKIGDKQYYTLDEAATNVKSGQTLTLLASTNETIVLPMGVTLVLSEGVSAPNVTVKQPVAKIGETGYETFDEAYTAAKDGDVIELFETAVISKTMANYNKKTITVKADGLETAFLVKSSVRMGTFAGMTIETDGTCITFGTMAGDYDPTVDINGGTYNGGTSAITVVSGLVRIADGVFSATDSENTIVGDVKNVNVNGGKFYNFNPTSYIPNNRIAQKGTDGYYAVAEAAAKIGDAKYADLASAINAAQAGETVTLLRNINLGDITSAVIVKKSITIDGEGYWTITINSVNDSWNSAAFAPRGPISYTFKNLTVDLKNAASDMAAFNMKYGGTLENVTVKGAFGQAVSVTMAYPVTVTNCTFDGATWGVYANASGAKATVTGTTFNTTGAVYLHKNGELAFENNIVAADSYVETDATVDVSKNFWNGNNATGNAPAAAQLKGDNIICDTYYAANNNGVLGNLTENGVAETAVIEIELDGETYKYGPSKLSLISKLLGSSTQANAVKVTLLDNVTLENGLQIAAYIEDGTLAITPKSVEVDLGGKTLTGFIQVNANVTATIKNGAVTATNNTYPGVDVTGKVTLDKVTINAENDVRVSSEAELIANAKIGNTYYASLADALAAAATMTGDVTVVINDKVTLNQALTGSYSSIKFVGNDTDAEIYLDVQGYITAAGKKVAFEGLTLSKSQGGFIGNAGFMNVAFGVYEVAEVTYTNCTFANGAYAAAGNVTFTGCTFKRSHDKYGLWAYGNVDVTVDGCTFADYRGIKMYAENGANAGVEKANLTVKNTNFSAVDNKPAIVLTYGESVALEGNTYSETGVFELDLDGNPNGVAVTSDVAPTCKNDNGACGVLVDGKIYTTVAQAAEVATETSTVTLLHSSNETVEFPMGTTIEKNGFTADNVTTAQPFAEYVVLPISMTVNNYKALFGTNTVTDGTNYYATLQAAVEAVAQNAGVTRQANAVLYCKPGAELGSMQHAPVVSTLTIYGNGASVTGFEHFDLGNTDKNDNSGLAITADMTLTIKNLNGFSVWGAKSTTHNVSVVIEECDDMGKVFITGTTGTLNIAIEDSEFKGREKEAVYSNADGAITLTNVAFSNLNKAVNLNHKAAGTQTVTINGCSFTDCGNDVAADQIPVRVLSSVNGGKTVLSVQSTTFAGTPTGGADILLDYGVGTTEATVAGTTANVVVEKENNVGTKTEVSTDNNYEFTTALPPVAKIGEQGYATLQAAINAVQNGETIILQKDCAEAVTFTQTKEVSFVLDGNNKTYTGSINITARAGKDAPSTLVIKNFNFKTDAIAHDFIKSVETNYYPNNITISNCKFEGTADINTENYAVVAVRLKSANNIKIENCTGSGLHSFLQNTAGWNMQIDNVDVTNSLSGFAMGTVQGAGIKNCDLTVNKSGIRFDAQLNNNAVITDNKINAFIPVVVRKASVESSLTFNGENTMTATNTDGIWCAVGTSEYEANGSMPTAATGKVKVTLNDTGLNAAGVYGDYVPVAKIGDVEYTSLEAAFAAATEGQTITMLDDAAPALTSQRAITKAAVIDLGGKTMTLTEDDLYFGTTTFKNGTIVVDPSVKPSTAVFWMFANQTLTFDNVKVVATGVTGTYLIGLDGDNSDLNLLNGSEILVENTSALDLDIICVNASTGNDIKVENSKVNVKNLDGRVFFRGNYTVAGNSEINLEGITKAGFRIEAGQTLSIEDNAVVNIVGEPRDGGIHMTDLSATYTKAETATVNATVNEPKVAKVGENTYRTLAQAVAAVEDGGTITLIANETFTKNNRYNNGGWWDGLGYSGDKSFTIDLAGFTISQDGSLNDYLLWFKNAGSKENTITIKNGTLDAGTTAFCALCTASSHDNKLTINTEDLTLINNISNGSTVKVRAGSVLNVKKGTKITGKNSYLGIENWNATVNIYDGAEIYMNGTSSYNGCLVGVGGGGTVNVYGGYGKGVKGGFIAMTSGGTINVAGGEWIANTDGTVGNNSNLYVLTAQSNKYESGFAGPSIINVTGGTLRGGMDAWVLNNLEGEKAELNISGGNFNANPENYVAEDYIAVENNGVWNVVKATAKIGTTKYNSLEAAFKAATSGCTIEILSDVTVDYNWDARNTGSKFTVPVTINGNGKTIKFTASVNDNNYQAPFRFEADATVKNLTIDMSEVTDNRFRAISSKGNLTVDGCKFIGKDESLNCRAIIFGEGAGTNVGNLAISITNSEFINWKRGITDNENAQDVKTATITGNTLENAAVYVSAYENVTFTGNTVEGAYVDIRSYTANSSLNVTATGNTLEENTDTAYNYIKATGNIDQEGFKVYAVAKIGDVEYTTIEKAYAALQEGDEIVILKKGSYALKVKNNVTITGAVDGVEFANIGAFGCNGANVTFNNVTFTYAENSTYKGLQHSGNLVYNNCTINGQVFLYGQSETFNKCTFNTTDSNNYNVWTYGAKVVAFNECTFNSAGKSVLIYSEQASNTNNVTVTKSQFIASQAVEGKAAIEMDSSLSGAINLTIDGETTATGFGTGNVSGNSLWNNKKGNNDVANNDITVKVGDTVVLAPIFEAQIGDAQYRFFQDAINAVQNGETITVLRDIATNVEIKEKDNVKVTIDGNGMKMTGTIKVVALSSDNDRRITIKNFKFEDTTSASVDFITSVETNHYPRITVEGCTFTGSGDATDVALRLKSSKNVEIKNCTGKGLHSFLQNTSGWNLTIENVTVTESKSGLALGTVQGVTVKGCDITAAGYGIRMDAGYNNNAVIESNTIEAFIPVVVRKATVNSNIAVNGTNNLTATNNDGLWMAIGTSEYEADGAMPTAATGNVVVALNDADLDSKGIYGNALAGQGTAEAPYLINNIGELVLFRNSVNAGETKYSAPGVHVALGADIDMAGENWVGIGSATKDHGFMGNFDGQGYKIKNLTITDPALDSDGYAYAGLFAVTEGTDKNNQNTIKNLIIENVTITTTGHIAAAAIAYPYYTVVDNVKVCGDIAISGGDYTAGVLAYTRRCVNASNLSIIGENNSFVEGKQVVGGVISDIQMNGGLKADYKNFSAEGVTVSGTKNVGGISGIIATQTLNGATVKNVTLNSDNAGVGIVAGCLGGTSTISNVTYENVTGASTLLGTTYDGGAIEAKIDNTYYATLDAALAAEGEATVELFVPVTVATGESRVIELNGKTVIGTDNATGSFALININPEAELTINGEGAIKLTATNNRGWNAYSSVISNQRGKLTVNGGTIEHLGGTDMAYAIDNLTNTGAQNAETVINGGTVKSTYRAIRQFLNSTSAQNVLTVNGGTIEGANKSIWMQGANANANPGALTVEAAAAIKGDVYLTTAAGTAEYPVVVAVAADALKDGAQVLTSNVPADFAVANVNGTWTKVDAAASLNGKGYATLRAAVEAAQNGETVELLANVTLAGGYEDATEGLRIEREITLNGNGHTIDCGNFQKGIRIYNLGTDGDFQVNFNNVEVVNNVANGRCIDTRSHDINLTITDSKLIAQNGNSQPLTIGGSEAIQRVKLDAATIDAGNSGYGVICFVPVKQNIYAYDETKVSGYAAFYLKDHGNKNIKLSLGKGTYVSKNIHSGESNTFGTIVLEGDNNTLQILGTTPTLKAITEGNASQAIVLIIGANNTVSLESTSAKIEVEGENAYYGMISAENAGTTTIINKGNTMFPVAEVGGFQFMTIKEAIRYAGNEGTIKVVNDFELAEAWTIPAGKKYTLDLNGKTVTYTSAVAGEDMITNRGNLTITDSSDAKTGKLAYVNTDNTASNVTVSTISTEAGSTLVVDGGTIENKTVKADGSSIYSYAIDILTNGNLGDVNVTINGGTVYSDYMAIRQFNNGTACKNSLTINGGYIYGAKRAVQVHMDNNAAVTAIKGGKVEAGEGGYAICNFAATSDLAVTGGEFIGAVYSARENFISGGIYDAEVYAGYCAEGYMPNKNTNGTYGVVAIADAYASIDGVTYGSLAAAVAAAKAGDTITLLQDVKESVTISKNLSIDGAGNTITGMITTDGKSLKVTIKNVNFDGNNKTVNYAMRADDDLNLVVENCSVKDYLYGFLYANKSNDKIVVKNVTVENCAEYGAYLVAFNKATFENFTVSGTTKYGIAIANAGARTVNLKNVSFENAETPLHINEIGTGKVTFNFSGSNDMSKAEFYTSQYVNVVAVAQVGTKVCGSLQDAVVAANDGETVKVLADVNMTTANFVTQVDGYATLVNVAGKAVTIDLNGKKVTVNAADADLNGKAKGNMLMSVFHADPNGTLTLTDSSAEGTGTVELFANDAKVYGLIVSENANDKTNPGKIIVNGGNYKADKLSDSMIFADINEVITVNGGNFHLGNIGTGANGSPWIFNAAGINQIHINVNGGTYNANVAKQYWTNEVNLGEGLTTTNNGDGTWTVVPAVAEVVDGESYGSIQEAIDAAQDGQTVKLIADVTLDTKKYTTQVDNLVVLFNVKGKAVTFDLNGKKIDVNASAANLGGKMLAGVFSADLEGNFTITDSSAEGTGAVNVAVNDANVYSVFISENAGDKTKSGKMTVNAGTFTTVGKVANAMIFADTHEVVTINGGTFICDGVSTGEHYPWMVNTTGNNTLQVVVNGGTFNVDVNHQYRPFEVFVPENLAVKANGNGTWTIVPAEAYVTEMLGAWVTETGDNEHNVGYATVAEAFAAVKSGETVTMVADAALTETVVVPAGKEVVLDLNGMTISAAITEQLTKSFAAIQNRGTLTIKDASAEADGKISVSYAGNSFGYGVGLYTISNEGGVLNIEGGTVENTTTVDGSMYDAIDNNSTLGETVLNISGGEVVCGKYIGVRQFANNTTYDNIVNVTGGKVVGGNTSIWMQNPGSNQPKATIAISGADYENGIYPVIEGRLLAGESTGFNFEVTGGLFDTDVNAFCAADYASYNFGDGTWGVEYLVLDELTIVDGDYTEFENQNAKTVGTLTYKRDMSNYIGKWQSLYVPFEIPVEKLTALGYQVAIFYDVHFDLTDEGDLDLTSAPDLHILKITSGTLKANYPYVIKASADHPQLSLELSDAKLYSTAKSEMNSVESGSTITRFIFAGTYAKATPGVLTGDANIPCYAINTNGNFQKMGTAANLPAFRVYMSIVAKDGSHIILPENVAQSIRMRVIGEENENGETIIYDVVMDEVESVDGIYDLQGRRVLEPLKGNLYIINGKKVIF